MSAATAWDAAIVLGAIEAGLETSRRCGARVVALEAIGASPGPRVAARTTVEALLGAIRALDVLLVNRRSVVIHAVIAEGIDAPLVAREHARAVAIRSLGVVVLHARDAQHAIDLTVVAHRIADDLEAPVVVLHDGGLAGRVLDRVTLPAASLIEAMLSTAPEKLSSSATTPASGWDERATFALGSALRAFERASGHTCGALDTHDLAGADAIVVASGGMSAGLREAIELARAAHPGVKVGLVQVTALRPLPAAQLVKLTARAKAIAIVERTLPRLSHVGALAMEVKAAFADALTWAPDYPGIGRIPVLCDGSVDPSDGEPSAGELLAVVENVLQGEQARRQFRVGRGWEGASADRALPVREPAPVRDESAGAGFRARRAGDPALVAQLLGDLFIGNVRAIPRADEREPTFDVVVSPRPIHAFHAGASVDLVAIDRAEPSDAGEFGRRALADLRDQGLVVIVTRALAADALADLDEATATALRVRGASVWGVSLKEGGADRLDVAFVVGAMCDSLAPAVDRERVANDVERALGRVRPALEPARRDALARAAREAATSAVHLMAPPTAAAAADE